jgi:hypothetical protein
VSGYSLGTLSFSSVVRLWPWRSGIDAKRKAIGASRVTS